MRKASLVCVLLISGACGGEFAVDAEPADEVSAAALETSGLAPRGVAPGETVLADEKTPVSVKPGGEAVFRYDTKPGEHVAFRLDFSSTITGVTLQVDRWDGSKAVKIGITDAGLGIRVLAVVDQDGPRSFWVRLRTGTTTLSGTLSVTRTPFTDGKVCTGDCASLLQLPLANVPSVAGYTSDSRTVFRYQFGRRDMVMMIREAGRRMAAQGKRPFIPGDLSQWDGQTPGTDVGSLRHVSHQRGKDADITLYGTDGDTRDRDFCTVVSTADGDVCKAGTRHDFDGYWNARMYAPYLETGRVTMSFLDAELIPAVVLGAATAVTDGSIAASLKPLYSDGKHLQHWPNHMDHIHIRVSETVYGLLPADEPFEAP